MLKAILLGVLLSVPAAAQNLYPPQWKPMAISHWGGLDLLQDSTMIDGDAQSAMNVLTDNTYLEKRPGNVLLTTILPGYSVQYVNGWYAPNGSDYLVAQASQTFYVTNFSGAPVAISTVAAGYNITTVPAFSRLEVSDGFRPLWYYNGNTTGTVTDSVSGNIGPTCSIIAFKDSRIWCSLTVQGFSEVGNATNGGGLSTVIVSSKGGDGYYSVPYNVNLIDDAANRFDFNPDDGDQITCLANTPWGMYVGKRNSSYIVNGNGNLSYDPRILDPKIGCVDNRSVQMVYGVLQFLSVDGVYGYDGSGPPRLLSRELDPLMQNIRESQFSQGAWLTQLQPDWASGTESAATNNLPPLVWDYNSIPGEIFPSSGTLFDDNTDPSLQQCTSNLDPNTGLPFNCGVGFSSDTLVNIDTTSFPLSIGQAQVIPSSSGVQVWISSWPNSGNYTTTPTTWTVYEGSFSGAANGGSLLGGAAETGDQDNTMYTAAASSANAPSDGNGWNYGYWSVAWWPHYTNTSPASIGGECWAGAALCMEFDFMTTSPSHAVWSGYGLTVNQALSSGNNFTLALVKSVGATQTALGSANFTTNSASLAFSTFTVTKTPGGFFAVSINGAQVFTAFDNTPALNKATYSSLTLRFPFIDYGGGSYEYGQNYAGIISLNGFGPGQIISRPFDTGASAPLAGVLSSSYTLSSDGLTSLDFYVRDSTSATCGNADPCWSLWKPSSDSVLAVLPERYWQYEALFNTSIASETAQLSTIELDAVTTGYYYSKVDYIGQLITSWRQFGVDATNAGVYNYAVRSASFQFAANAALPAWTTQSPNQNVAVSTGAYAQFRLDSTPLVTNPEGASAYEPIISVALSWDQGQDIPVTSQTLDRRYIICVAISTTTLTPDTCLIRQKNGKWVQWGITTTIGAMGLYNNQMVAADGGTSSKVWKIMQPNVYNDDGVPINSSWVSADEVDGLPFNNKDYYGAMLDIQPVQFSSMTFGYQVNKSSGFVSTTFSIDNGQPLSYSLPVIGSEYGSINQWVPPPAGFDIGKYIRLQFSDNTLNNYWRLNDYLFFVKDESFYHP